MDQKWQSPPPPFDYHALENDIPWWVVEVDDIHVFGLSDWLDSYVPGGWKPKAIHGAIDHIVGSAMYQDVFQVGRRFAELISTCGGFENSLTFLLEWLNLRAGYDCRVSFDEDVLNEEAGKADSAHAKLCETMRTVLASDHVRRCQHAASILEWELHKQQRLGQPSGFALADHYTPDEYGPVPWFDEDAESYHSSRYSYLTAWSGCSGVAWLAFGDVLGTLRETDLATAGRDRPLPSLRHYQLKGDSSMDRVRAAVQLAERELATEANTGQHPEIVITCVAHGIEALARRLWSNDFSTGDDARRTLVAILDQKRRFGKIELEQRFATLALSLYSAYRKPAIHDPDKFRCTWAEAHFFVSGMRVLFDISERLIQDTDGD